jgi:hypothetical protein
MIVYRNKFIRILECWDDEQPGAQDVDLIRRFQQPQSIDGMFCREFYTILIDLHQDQDVLLSRINRDTRYEIRRGARDNFVYDLSDGEDAAALNEFCDFYDGFAARKNQPKMRRGWLSLLARSHSFRLSRIAGQDGATMVWHGYHCTGNRATLLYSASDWAAGDTSAGRSKLGRANRFQHWQDLLSFKAERISTYDFGGWYEGQTDRKRLQINKFKEEFGGQVIRNYICEHPLTWKGTLFLRARQSLLGNAI